MSCEICGKPFQVSPKESLRRRCCTSDCAKLLPKKPRVYARSLACDACQQPFVTERRHQTTCLDCQLSAWVLTHAVPAGSRLVPLVRGYFTAVDPADYDRVIQHAWSISRNGYALRAVVTDCGQTGQLLHRFILNAAPEEEVDHRDRDRLNNTRENLRICTRSQNCHNSGKSHPRSSEFKGVEYVRRSGAWLAEITANGQTHRLGTFPDERSAARAYDAAAVHHHGDFAALNFPTETPLPLEDVLLLTNRAQRKTSRYLGVNRFRDRWIARVRRDGQEIRLGSFSCEEDAARAYDQAIIACRRAGAKLNFPP
jgi:hypothetical protein